MTTKHEAYLRQLLKNCPPRVHSSRVDIVWMPRPSADIGRPPQR